MAEGGVGISDATKPEYEALQKSYSTLVSCMERSVGTTTDELFSLGVFSKDEVKSLRNDQTNNTEKARKILDAVMSKVESEPSFINEFIKILDKEAWMKPYIEVLKTNLDVEQKSKVIRVSILTSEHTVELSKDTSTDLDATDSPPLEGNLEVPAKDIYTYLKNDIETRLTTKKQFDENDLEEATKDIQHQFASVVTNIAMALKECRITTRDLAFHLSELGWARSDSVHFKIAEHSGYFSEDFVRKVVDESQGDIYEFFKALRRYYSWINYDLIKSIKNTFLRHNDNIQALWEEYQLHYKEYCKKRVCKIPKPINGIRSLSKRMQKSRTVAFKVDAEWHEIRFDMIESIQSRIKKLLGLESYTLYLSTVEQGCVELTFEVPLHISDILFPPTKQQLQELQKHNIKYCGLSPASTETLEECKPNLMQREEDEGYWSKGTSLKEEPFQEAHEIDYQQSWKIIAIGERNTQKYEIINGLLGQESVFCPASPNDSVLTDITVSGVNIEVVDTFKIGAQFSEKNVHEMEIDTILYFLPKHGYRKNIQNIARYCKASIWKKIIIIVDFSNEIKTLPQKISQIREDITDILFQEDVFNAGVIKQILPISNATYLHLPGHRSWFSLLCCTVLKTSSYSTRICIEKIFTERKYEDKHSKMLLKRHIDLKVSKMFTLRENIRKQAAMQPELRDRFTIGACIGSLYSSLSLFGVGAGAGLMTGSVAISEKQNKAFAPCPTTAHKTTKDKVEKTDFDEENGTLK